MEQEGFKNIGAFVLSWQYLVTTQCLQCYCAVVLQVQPTCDTVDSLKNIFTTKYPLGSIVRECYLGLINLDSTSTKFTYSLERMFWK